ncbi:MAG TPA: aminopeptidase N [Paracoccaceae bacterium]|nr:aminopeptidase N [Paracoccaceae bacterium]
MRPDALPAQTPTRLSDYRPPDWLVERVSLTFDLAPSATRVRTKIAFRRNGDASGGGPADLVLHGRKLTLVSAAVDGRDVTGEVETTREELRLAGPLPDRFEWECEAEIDPQANTELEGLYLSKGMYCTQCEAEGFRKITYYPDRPDVMAVYEVRIEADKASCPVLLSNGNPVAAGELPGGRHFAEWHDPFPKPSYLFALVAGDLVAHENTFRTMSGRDVRLQVWVRPGDEDRCAYAMDSLKRSMKWDEEAYGREYDLDLFMIVAVDDFNMGAMENKGLNVFNSKYVRASPETATDRDYEMIESIVAHEYFHNWTGNRITCRDWFQLCLKEGLTVFRDQQFSEHERSAAVTRIGDVQALRARQFREDAGPLAHPVRPEEYVEINNFYTATVYEKGAEVIRMLRTIVGPEHYRKALDLYFERHDGQACTIEDWLTVFEDATGRDLSQFKRWYTQAGTPRVSVSEDWDEGSGRYTLTLAQRTPPTPGQKEKAPLVIPVAYGLLGQDGREMEAGVLELTEAERSWTFDLPERPVPSLLRGFSAPVILERKTTDAERAFLLAHDTDPFARWEAGRAYGIDIALAVMRGEQVPTAWTQGLGNLLADGTLDPAFKALALDAPGEEELAAEIAGRGEPVDPEAVHRAVDTMRRALGTALAGPLAGAHEAMATPGPYSPDAASAGRRALRNRAMALLAQASNEGRALADRQFADADNMSESLPALTALVHYGAPTAGARLAEFQDRWQADPLVLDKWLALQASSPQPDTLARVRALAEDPDFEWKNPNKIRSLIGVFAAGNPSRFHAADGSGYRFVADWLMRLDAINPQTAARVAGVFETWARYDAGRQEKIRAEMERILALPDLSRNTREIVERMLGAGR